MSFFDHSDESYKPEKPEESKKCFRCSFIFQGHPRDHQCYDGTTFEQRIAELNMKRHDKPKEHYNAANFTPSDVRWLRGVKIDPFKTDIRTQDILNLRYKPKEAQ